MAIKTLTPMQLWADYDCDKDCMAINITATTEYGGITELDFAFTAMITDGGITRARANVKYIKPNNETSLPILIYLGNGNESFDFHPYIEAGYGIVECDFLGINGTVFASDVNYAKLGNEGDHLTAKLGADQTALFIRSKIIRRLISALHALPMLDSSRIALMGWGESCDIVWQVAAIDRRVGVIVPFLNSGWRKNSDESLTDDERLRWDIGCSVQANAKFVDCKVLLCVATNNSEYSFDKLGDTIKLLKPSAECRVIISPQLDNQVYDDTITIIKYIKAVLVNTAPLIDIPTLNCIATDGKLAVNTRVDGAIRDVIDVQLYYSYDNDSYPQFRNWYAQSVGSDIQGLGCTTLKVYDINETIHLFIIASYKNGLKVCSEPYKCIPSELGNINTVKRNTRIVYERKMGTSQFVEMTNGSIIKPDGIKLMPGALDILGVTTDNGDILTYRIGEIIGENNESILQFDLFTTQLDSCEIVLIDVNKSHYTANYSVRSHDEWNKAQLRTNDFKGDDLVPLKSWDSIKCMIIKNADKILLNNIIWV